MGKLMKRVPDHVRGSPTIEFSPKLRSRNTSSREEPWPTYGRDQQRTHVAPFPHRPPFRQFWRINTPGIVEFPPTIAYGRVYFSSEKGNFYALDAASGRVIWTKRIGHCAPASPMLAHNVVYQSYALPLPCVGHDPHAPGFVVAWDAATGRGSGGTSPLLSSRLRSLWASFFTLAPGTGRSTR